MASEILLMRIGQCIKDLGTLKEVISKSEENESKYAEIKTLVIDVLDELASETPDKSAVDCSCNRLKDFAQEYNDAGDNLEMKKAVSGLAGRIVLLRVEEYPEFLEKITQDDKYGAINYLLQSIENAMSPAKLYDVAWDAYRSKNYENVLKYASLAIEKGSLEAYLLLGLLYDDEAWVKHDEKRAYEIYKEGAIKGDAECQYMTYLRLMNGNVVAQNIEEAYEWLVKSANGESPYGMTALGKVFCQQSMARYTEAFQWFEKAADKGNLEAKVWIGYCYEKGFGVGRDTNRAKAIYQYEMNNDNRFAKEFYDNLLDKERRTAEENRRREEQRRRDEEKRKVEENRRREEQRRREEEQRRRDEERRRVEARRRKEEEERRKKRNIGCGCILILLLLGLLWAGYEFWLKDYLRDKNAPRTYVYATNLFLRSSKNAESENNRIDRIPYGAELVTYSNADGWAEVKYDGEKGYVSSAYLLSSNDFKLLDGIWGNEEAKEMVMTSKCRMALLDLLKRYGWQSGANEWQLYTKQKEMKPNSVLYPSLNDGYDEFSEFAFILTDNQSKKRKFVLYSFKDDEVPVFRYVEDAPEKGDIRSVSYDKWNKKYKVIYSKQNDGHVYTKEAKVKPVVQVSNSDIEITQVAFANVDYNNNVIASYGAQLYQDTKYLKAKVDFKRKKDANEKMKFQIKILLPNGTMLRGGSSPAGYTFEQEISLAGKSGHFFTLGWGNSEGSSYTPGAYTYEIWYNGKKVFATTFNIENRTWLIEENKSPETATDYDDVVFERAEQMPLFPGGTEAMMKYLQNNLRYPSTASENGVQGRVVVSFVIEKDGRVSNATVVKGINSSLDREALRSRALRF